MCVIHNIFMDFFPIIPIDMPSCLCYPKHTYRLEIQLNEKYVNCLWIPMGSFLYPKESRAELFFMP